MVQACRYAHSAVGIGFLIQLLRVAPSITESLRREFLTRQNAPCSCDDREEDQGRPAASLPGFRNDPARTMNIRGGLL